MENSSSNVSLLAEPINESYVSFDCADHSDSDSETLAQPQLSESVESNSLNETIRSLNNEIVSKMKTSLSSTGQALNSAMLATFDITQDFEQESTNFEFVAGVQEKTVNDPKKNNVSVPEPSTSTVTFVNLDEGEGFSASTTRDFGQIIATTVDEQTFNNLYDQIAADAPQSSFLSTSIIAKPNENGNIDIFLPPKNATPCNVTPKKAQTKNQAQTPPTKPIKRKLPTRISSRIPNSRKPSYMRVVMDESSDDSDYVESAKKSRDIFKKLKKKKNQKIDKAIGEIPNESDKEIEIDHSELHEDASEDDQPEQPISKKESDRRAAATKNYRRRRNGEMPKMNLISKNLMPTPPSKYKTEYVVAEKPKENGKGSTKEIRKLTWTVEPPTTKSTLIVRPVDEPSKISCSAKCTDDLKDPLTLFNSILTDDVCNKIVKYTNSFARKEAKQREGTKQYKAWKETDIVEIRAFIGSILFLGAHHKANLSIDKIFTTNWYELNLPTILSFSRNRFKDLLRYMRFSPKTGPQDNSEAENRLIKIQELFDPIIENSRALVTPGNVITVDEAVIGFKGRCQFTQYLPNKPAKYGIKVWCACDAKTGYLLNGQIYSGKVGKSPEVNQGRRVVMHLLEPYFGTSRIVVTDNFFTSVHLAEDLKAQNLGLVGTLRDGRPGVPKELFTVNLADEKTKKKKSTKKGKNDSSSDSSDSSDDEPDKPLPKYKSTTGRPRKCNGKNHFDTRSAFLFTTDLTVVKSLVKPKRSVCLLSSVHHAPMISTDDQAKPEIILFYNQGKGGVDLLGQVVKNLTCKQTTFRWPYRVFSWLMDVAAYNAYVVYRSLKSLKDTDMENCRREFLTKLSIQLMEPLIQRRCKTEKPSKLAHISKVKTIAFASMKLKNDQGKQGLNLLGVQDEIAADQDDDQAPTLKSGSTKKKAGVQVPRKANFRSKAAADAGAWRKPAPPNRVACDFGNCKKIHRRTQWHCRKCGRPACRQHGHVYPTEEGGEIFLCLNDAGIRIQSTEESFATDTTTIAVQCQI